MLSICVMLSGRGSNFSALLDATAAGAVDGRIALVISDKPEAGGLALARAAGIPAEWLSERHFPSATEYTTQLLALCEQHGVDFIVLAGYLKKIPELLVQRYRNRLINIHPALLPSFGGPGLYGRRVHEAVLAYGCKVSGATVHLVDADYDTGAPVLQECVPVLEGDTPETLAARVLEVEHRLLPRAVQLFARDRVRIDGRRVIVLDGPDHDTAGPFRR